MKKTASDANQAVRFEARIWREASDTTQEQRDQVTGGWKDVPVHHDANWAVYHVATGLRMDYSKDEASAKATADKWNSGKLPLAMANKAESATDLRKLLQPGDTVTTILRSVSRSGMQRRISLVVARNNEITDITWDAARVMGDPIKQGGKYVQDAGMVVSGCGMDMGFHIVYHLSRTLFPDGFPCIGDGCRSNAHSNGERDRTPHGAVCECKGCVVCGHEHSICGLCSMCVVCHKHREGCEGCKGCNLDPAAPPYQHWHGGDGGYALAQRWL